ncbi:MAG: O-antigen ligase family protein [Patescibacteria group bacterium]
MALIAEILLIISFAIGNTYKFHNVSFLDLSVFIIWLVFFIKNGFKISIPKPLLVFLVIAGTSLLLAQKWGLSAQLVGLQYLFRFFIYATLPFFHDQKRLVYRLGIVTVVAGLAQYVFLPDVRFLSALGWDDHYYRVIGSFLDPGFTGLLLVLFLVFFFEHRHRFMTILSYLALALTYSRSSYLAFSVAFAIIAWQKRSIIIFAKAILILLFTLIILPRNSGGEGVRLSRTSSIQARITNWKESLQIFSDHPIIGVGFNTYRFAKKDYGFLENRDWQTNHAGAGADSSLLFVAATTGLLGLTAYLLYLKKLYMILDTKYFIPIIAHSIFLNSLFYPAVMLLIALLITVDNSPRSLSSKH